MQWYLNDIKKCSHCYHIIEKNKYEFLKKCNRCHRIRGYKPKQNVSRPSLYLDDYFESPLLDFSKEEIDFLQSCFVEPILPDFTSEEIELFLEIMN